VQERWRRVVSRATVTGAPKQQGSVTVSPLLPLTGSENQGHLQKKEKKYTRQ
jgi:hypothetical protein